MFRYVNMVLLLLCIAYSSAKAESGGIHSNLKREIPLSLVLQDIGESFQDVPSTFSIKQAVIGSTVENPNKAKIIVEETTPTDDSIAAMQYTYKLSYNDDKWIIESKNIKQRCIKGRGKTFFSKSLCH